MIKYTVDLRDVWATARSFEERRDQTIIRLLSSDWADLSQYSLDLGELLAGLARTEMVEDFDEVWDELLDLAAEDGAVVITQ